MALNSIQPYSLNKKAEFGKVQLVHNSNTGANINRFVSQFSLWCMPYTRAISQQISLTPEQLDQPIIIVRHNTKVTTDMLVEYDGIQYSIMNISSDDSNKIIAYDYITLRKKGK
ncbi:phage head closure protein [Lactobacillus sp. ESL0791]|uniref:phage head closure protein n=1 Tax=Lactobacillus sp. ESL0791 TaxID=2983234 RepID=UPI0023F7C0BF|nr:phage head closure protein [Lactobacillus sp. ESL0791]MDF7639959.1 phage head closure protein [Lactobacillus sp. ESL0791]